MRQFTKPILFNSVMGQRILRVIPWGCAFLFISIVVAIFAPVFLSARAAATTNTALRNLKKQAEALLAYSNDHNDRFPSAMNWMDEIAPYVSDQSIYHDPKRNEDEFGYAMNADLSGKDFASVFNPSLTILTYETKRQGRNLYASGLHICDDALVRNFVGVSFVDGHTTRLTLERLKQTVTEQYQTAPVGQ
jgi:hypothetical protein